MTSKRSLLAMTALVLGLAASPARSQESTAEDYINFWKPLVGSWNSTTEVDGKSQTGTWRAELARNGKCFLSYGQGFVESGLQSIHGYDPVARQWMDAGFDPEGNFSLVKHRIADMKKGKTLRPGETVTGEAERKLFRADGKTITTTDKWSVTMKDKDHVVFVMTERREDGKPISNVTWVMKRDK